MKLDPAQRVATELAKSTTVFALLMLLAGPVVGQRLDGFNVIMSKNHAFGSESARRSLANARRSGARAVAIVPFLWQPSPSSPDVTRGSDMPDDVLRAAIHDAHTLGLAVLVKPQVWIPEGWAGAVAMDSEGTWRQWFANYRRELLRIARLAEEEKAGSLVIGTELAKTSQRSEWVDLISDVRSVYSGRLLYVAHNADEAEVVPFWAQLDAIGVSLYPALGRDENRVDRQLVMRAEVDRLDVLAGRAGRTIIIGEIGLRSAVGAAGKPWESAEERDSAPDLLLQALVLTDWLDILARPRIQGVLIWRWFTNPNAGGAADTDFTVQGKPAERVLCARTKACAD
jgi:hypothetical protein